MSKVYTIADDDVMERIERIIADQHPDLVEAKVTVGALFVAHDKDPKAQVLTLHGYDCAATIKKNTIVKRVQGHPDATITIDAATWKRLPEKSRDALIDHELTHLHVKRKGDFIAYDKDGRPKLEMKLHDWQLGGFAVISKRYGKHALEVQAVKIATDDFGQLFWNFDNAPNAGNSRKRGAA